MADTETRQIKKKYISDRIKESIDVFGSQPERLGTIIMGAVAVLVMLISKVLQKAREMSARLTKKSELQSKIDRKNEEIDILKIGLSGIVRRYGYQNVQEFNRTFHKSYNAYVAYREQEAEWNRSYGTDRHKQDKESVYERLKNQPKRTADYQQQRTVMCKDRGAR